MAERLSIGGFDVEVTKKDIKNIHLTVHPPTGVVKVSAPLDTDTQIVKAFVLTKLDWIKRHHHKMIKQARETEREFIQRESHIIWGRRYLLNIVKEETPRQVSLSGNTITLNVRPADSQCKRAEVFEEWCRKELRAVAEPISHKWRTKLDVGLDKIHIQRMKTKWGSCRPDKSSIRLNTELIHKPKEALEFVIVHELLHFIEQKHSPVFFGLMDNYLPKWQMIRQNLNELPLSFSISSPKSSLKLM